MADPEPATDPPAHRPHAAEELATAPERTVPSSSDAPSHTAADPGDWRRYEVEPGCPTGTRVELEHSGWEQGAKIRDAQKSYDGGWDLVLGHYQARARAAA